MKRYLYLLLTTMLTLVWVSGGLVLDKQLAAIVGALVACLWLTSVLFVRLTIELPRFFWWWCLLLGLSALSIIWSSQRIDTAQEVVLMASGGLWWLGSKTMSANVRFRSAVKISVLCAGVVFTVLWLLAITKTWQLSYGPSSLVVEASSYKNHNHIGDWWMVMLILSFSQGVAWEWVLPAVVMLWASRSRSADVGALVGLGYLAWMREWWIVHKKKMIVGAIVLVGIFLIMGLGKVTLGARDYYVQVVAGLVTKYPWGVGWGNFQKISHDSSTHWWGRGDFSSVVHCLPLEWLAGMGWLGLVGWIWLGFVSWRIGFVSKRDKGMWRAVYWAMLINFCLDTTYLIPSMWWLWMVVIGLAEE